MWKTLPTDASSANLPIETIAVHGEDLPEDA
jgi:hypothetical protein